MFHSAERTVAMDVTVPQAVHMDPRSSSAFQFHLLPYARHIDAPIAVRQPDTNVRTSPRSNSMSEAMFCGSHHVSDQGSLAAVRVTACPESLTAKHPTSWSKDDVKEWLDWSMKEFELDDAQQKFSMNGKALCILSKEGFCYRAPNAGDLLHELLQKLLSRGDGSTRPVYEPTPRFTTSDQGSRDHTGSDDSGKRNTPELQPLNLKMTDNAHRSSSSSGHSTPHTALDDESQQSPRPMVVVHQGYPPYLPPYPTVHPKTLHEPRCDTPTGQSPQRHIHSPAHCSSPPSGKSPATHSAGDNLNRKRNFSPYYSPSLPHPQSRTGVEFANTLQEYNPQRKHRREMIEAHLSSSEGRKNSSAPPSGDVSFDNRPVLLDILTGPGCQPSSVLPYSQMKVHNKVHVPVIQSTAEDSTNGNTCTRVTTNCTANQMSPYNNLDSLSHQRDIVPLASFSHQYPYRLAPSVDQTLTGKRSPPSFFSNMFDVKNLRDPQVEAATPEMDCGAGQDGAGKKKGHRPLLWQFLWLLLKDKNNLHSICWEDETCLVFRIIDTEKVAKLWGREKNRLNMTYEKMSRAMRYYYNTGILCKEPGHKLTYRFLTAPEDLANSRHLSKKKVKTHAVCDAESTEGRICREVDTPKSDSSERDPESAEEMSSPGSACDTPIVVTTVAKEGIRIKREPDDLGAPVS